MGEQDFGVGQQFISGYLNEKQFSRRWLAACDGNKNTERMSDHREKIEDGLNWKTGMPDAGCSFEGRKDHLGRKGIWGGMLYDKEGQMIQRGFCDINQCYPKRHRTSDYSNGHRTSDIQRDIESVIQRDIEPVLFKET